MKKIFNKIRRFLKGPPDFWDGKYLLRGSDRKISKLLVLPLLEFIGDKTEASLYRKFLISRLSDEVVVSIKTFGLFGEVQYWKYTSAWIEHGKHKTLKSKIIRELRKAGVQKVLCDNYGK